jgi:hypothetical protein
MIRHQDVGVHVTFEALRQFLKVAQVKLVILLGEKAGDTIVSPLNDVKRDPCKPKTRSPWHIGSSLDDIADTAIQRGYLVTR